MTWPDVLKVDKTIRKRKFAQARYLPRILGLKLVYVDHVHCYNYHLYLENVE